MASTGWLKFTYLIHFGNIIILPIIGIALVIIAQVLVEVFTFGNSTEDSINQIKEQVLPIFAILSLIYLIITIGLIRKINLFRILGILLDGTLFGLILISTIQKIILSEGTIKYGVFIFELIYFIPIYTLSIHKDTIKLFQ